MAANPTTIRTARIGGVRYRFFAVGIDGAWPIYQGRRRVGTLTLGAEGRGRIDTICGYAGRAGTFLIALRGLHTQLTGAL